MGGLWQNVLRKVIKNSYLSEKTEEITYIYVNDA